MKKRYLYAGMLCTLLLSGCNHSKGLPGEKAEAYDANYEIIGSEKQEIVGDINPVIFKSVHRKNEKASNETIELDIEKIENDGVHLPTGRYRLSGEVSGRFLIFDGNGKEIFQELVNQQGGVESVVLDIDGTYTIKADGFTDVYATGEGTSFENELTARLWEVGKDIKAGDYVVSAGEGLGHLQVLEKENEPRLYELIGGEFVNTESKVHLQDGEILKITGVNSVHFQKL